MQRISILFLVAGLLFTFINAAAQTPAGGARPSVATGDVVSVDSSKIVLQTNDGAIDVMLSDKTEFKRVPADNPVLKAAVASALSDIAAGDKLIVTGFFSEDKKTLPARSVYLMSKSDIAEKQKKDSEKWATRGISGKVSAVNQDTKQITVEVRGLMNTTTVVLTPKSDAKFRRYAPNSVKYSEAVESSIADLKPGDMIRALGDKSADGASFAAEEIVTGAFQTVAGTVKSVDVARNEVVITELQSKKDVTVNLGSATMLKKFPEEMATRMASFQGGRPGGAGAPGGGPPMGGQRQPGQGGGGPGRGGFGGQRAGGIDEMLERFPNITAADLKAGDIIAVSSTKTSNLDRITAIKLLAGVEPFIRAAQASSGPQGRQTTQSLNIPGLDGLDFP